MQRVKQRVNMKGVFVILIIVAVGTAWYYVPAKHHQAATGTYFVREYVSLNTSGGVIGWAPGQEVHESLKAPYVEGGKTVTDGTFTALIPEAALDQDIENAEAMRLADHTVQGQAENEAAAMQAQYAEQVRASQVASARSVNQANAEQAAASAVGTYNTRLNEPTHYVGGGGGWSSVYYANSGRSAAGSTGASVSGQTRGSGLAQVVRASSGAYDRHAKVMAQPTPSSVGTAR